MRCEVVMKTPYLRTVSFGLLIGLLTFYPRVISSQESSAQSSTTTSVPAYGNCPAPTNAGVRICHPFNFDNSTTIASPFQLIASGTGANGPVRHMEVWIDFAKVKQASGNLFDAPVTLSSGTHRLVVVELDTTGAFMKSTPITVSIQGSTADQSCPPPGSPGVNVCEPSGVNSCHTSAWTTILASGTGASGSVHRMELWSSGVKLANFPGDTINTNLYLPDFSTVTIVEVDSAGAFIKSPRFTIQSC
jgi:hypothetical protein